MLVSAGPDLEYMIVNMREALPEASGRRPREFLLVFPGFPVTASVTEGMRAVERQLRSAISTRSKALEAGHRGESEAMLPLTFAGAGMTIVRDLGGTFEQRQKTGRCGETLSELEVVFVPGGGTEEGGECVVPQFAFRGHSQSQDETFPLLSGRTAPPVQFCIPYTYRKTGLFNLREGLFMSRQLLFNMPGLGFEPQDLQKMPFALLEAQVHLAEELWRIFGGVAREKSGQVAVEVRELHFGVTTGAISSPVNFLVTACAQGVKEENGVRAAAVEMLGDFKAAVGRVAAEIEAQNLPEGDARSLVRAAVKAEHRRLLLRWHPDKNHLEKEKSAEVIKVLNAMWELMARW